MAQGRSAIAPQVEVSLFHGDTSKSVQLVDDHPVSLLDLGLQPWPVRGHSSLTALDLVLGRGSVHVAVGVAQRASPADVLVRLMTELVVIDYRDLGHGLVLEVLFVICEHIRLTEIVNLDIQELCESKCLASATLACTILGPADDHTDR